MGLQGYVGSGEDVRRIRRQEQQLEDERKKREAEKQQREANVSAAGFRQFGKGAAEVSGLSVSCNNRKNMRTIDSLYLSRRRSRLPLVSKLLAL